MDKSIEIQGRSYGKTALMWGGLLTIFAAFFHLGLLIAGPEWAYLAGIPRGLSGLMPFPETGWILLIILVLLGVSLFAFSSRLNWPLSPRRRLWIGLIAFVFLFWGVTGAPINHLSDWSHRYSIFHVGAAFYITFVGACFAYAAWVSRDNKKRSS